jgi:hypothetical protein
MAAALAGGCVAGGGAPSSTPIAPESVWRVLNQPRPELLASAPRVSVTELILLDPTWAPESPVTSSIGLHELVAAGLIRRRDVQFVERRRFVAAVGRETQGLPRLRNSSAPGISPGAELQLAGSWTPSGDAATLDLRLVVVETGAALAGWRTTTPQGVDPTSVARAIVGSTVSALRGLKRLPLWDDPLANGAWDPAPQTYTPSGVSDEAVQAFFRGVQAEDRFDWEGARRAYQEAMEMSDDSFFEPDVALARVARLRAGGTLGGSE